jgi:hypothetical protein
MRITDLNHYCPGKIAGCWRKRLTRGGISGFAAGNDVNDNPFDRTGFCWPSSSRRRWVLANGPQRLYVLLGIGGRLALVPFGELLVGVRHP